MSSRPNDSCSVEHQDYSNAVDTRNDHNAARAQAERDDHNYDAPVNPSDEIDQDNQNVNAARNALNACLARHSSHGTHADTNHSGHGLGDTILKAIGIGGGRGS